MTIKTTLLAVVLLFTIASCSKEEAANVSPEADYTIDLNLAQQNDWAMVNDILALVNAHRVSIGLTEIVKDQQYASAYAVEHSQYMIDVDQINHDNFTERSQGLKSRGATIVGENVAFGYNTAEDVVNAWLNSPGHRKIIEGAFTHSGFGVVKSEDNQYYFTQLFYRK